MPHVERVLDMSDTDILASTEAVNSVIIVGRLSAPPERKELPSGDVLWTWRMVVNRPKSHHSVKASQKAAVDTIDCTTFSKTLGRSAEKWEKDAVLEVAGALRRRFFKTPTGTGSRYEVECHAAKKLKNPIK